MGHVAHDRGRTREGPVRRTVLGGVPGDAGTGRGRGGEVSAAVMMRLELRRRRRRHLIASSPKLITADPASTTEPSPTDSAAYPVARHNPGRAETVDFARGGDGHFPAMMRTILRLLSLILTSFRLQYESARSAGQARSLRGRVGRDSGEGQEERWQTMGLIGSVVVVLVAHAYREEGDKI